MVGRIMSIFKNVTDSHALIALKRNNPDIKTTDIVAYMNWIDRADANGGNKLLVDSYFLMNLYPTSQYMKYVRPEELKQ